jgi:flagellar motility protein MotE (MotC chaperone)
VNASCVPELLDWLSAAKGRGSVRFEVWIKPRGAEQRRAATFDAEDDLWNVADEAFSMAQRDRRAEQGFVSYAVFAFAKAGNGSEEPAEPTERIFLAPTVHVAAVPVSENGMAPYAMAASADAIAPVLQPILSTVHATFSLLQRENEHQRRSNESHVRAQSGHFDALSRGYERTFQELQRRVDAALAESAALREKIAALEAERNQWAEVTANLQGVVDGLEKVKGKEVVDAQRQIMRDRITAQTLEMGIPLAMALVTKTPLSSGVVGEAFTNFIKSITKEQLRGIFPLLNPGQQAVLGAFMKNLPKEPEPAGAEGNGAGGAGGQGAAAAGGTAEGNAAPTESARGTSP